MKVKICGIKDKQTALFAVEAGADAIGFIFAESKRKIDVNTAKEIAAALPKDVLKIGVFVNETRDHLHAVYEEVGLTHLQLHGDESPEFCRLIHYPVIKALSVSNEEDLERISHYDCDYILLDSPYGKYRGGNGTTFDWTLTKNKEIPRDRLILAGGLQMENVKQACEQVHPFMVDVSSGVETNGVKDLAKIAAFIQKVKSRGEE
jgi:phosphoribosylanthranilate isomerase